MLNTTFQLEDIYRYKDCDPERKFYPEPVFYDTGTVGAYANLEKKCVSEFRFLR